MTKRAVICVTDPWKHLDQFSDHSIMIVDPNGPPARKQYLLDSADWSVMLDDRGISYRDGRDYPEEFMVMYTSGTTGDSRLCGFKKNQVDLVIDRMIKDYELTSNDRYASIMPIWHGHGLLFMLATRTAGVETIHTHIRNTDEIEKFQPTFVTAIPDIAKLFSKLDLKNLRFVRTASQALPDATFHMLHEKFRVPVVEAFGMTESCSHCFTNPLRGKQKPGSIGLPSGIEARIDQQQHLWLRGPQAYYSDWFDTGDLASQDDEGYFKILGRSIDRINVRGYKIDPLSIENHLYNQFPELQECAVFGRDWLKCLVVGDVSLPQVKKFLESLGGACRPRFLESIDVIPKNANGKVSRTLLDQMFE